MEEVMDILKEYENIIKSIIKLIEHADKIAVLGHLNPDGDCVGAQLGFKLGLEGIGKKVDIINEGPFKGIYKDNFEKFFMKEINDEYDLFIVVDATDESRVGEIAKKIDFNKAVIIDHHYTNKGFGKINWISDTFISSSEMVFLLLYKMNLDFKNKEISQYLLNGLLSDNGFYQHIRANKYFSLLTSFLMIENGGDPKKSYDLMFCTKSVDSLKLVSLALGRIEIKNEGKILWSFISDEDREKLKNPNFESAMVFREMLAVIGCEIAVFFKINEKEKKVEVSFRSIDKHDVASVAQFFGGGGHKVASGVSINGTFDDVKKAVFDKLEKLITEN
jgi:bifunctional oligoribonuclease and PAP phosphatase NrnA